MLTVGHYFADGGNHRNNHSNSDGNEWNSNDTVFLTCLLNYVICMINETAALEYKGLSLKIKKAYAALDPEKSRPFIFIC